MSDEKLNLNALRLSCHKHLRGHHPISAREILSDLANQTGTDIVADRYGSGELIEKFEKKIATVLGKESAVFMPSGTMAQPIALRIWASRKGNNRFGMHETSHLEKHEHKAYSALHGLSGLYVGTADKPLLADDLARFAEPLASLIVELPMRELGGILPSWSELEDLWKLARKRNIAMHMDGARLWECLPYYGKTASEICSFFESVYVSFYKGLGGLCGAVLAGDAELIAEARIWQRRQGGNLVTLFPYVISAEAAFDRRLDRMNSYHQKAKVLASALKILPGVLQITPYPPHTNMMHIFLKGHIKQFPKALAEVASKFGIWVGESYTATRFPGIIKFELTVGDATLELGDVEVAAAFEILLTSLAESG